MFMGLMQLAQSETGVFQQRQPGARFTRTANGDHLPFNY